MYSITNRVYITRHVRVDESNFPFFGTSSHLNLSTLSLDSYNDDTNEAVTESPNHPLGSTSVPSFVHSISDSHAPCGM